MPPRALEAGDGVCAGRGGPAGIPGQRSQAGVGSPGSSRAGGWRCSQGGAGEWAPLSTAGPAAPTPAVVRKLNELYKASVLSCQGLSLRLQRFFLDKQRLLDRVQSVTAEKLIFSHAVQTVGGEGREAGGA